MVLQIFQESPIAATHAMVAAMEFAFGFLMLMIASCGISRQIFAVVVVSAVVFERRRAFVSFEGMQLPKA
jgi:hypothetical protein